MRRWSQRKKSQQKDLWHERISAYDDKGKVPWQDKGEGDASHSFGMTYPMSPRGLLLSPRASARGLPPLLLGMPHDVRHDIPPCHPERSEERGVIPSPSLVTPSPSFVIPSAARDLLMRFLGVLRFARDTSE